MLWIEERVNDIRMGLKKSKKDIEKNKLNLVQKDFCNLQNALLQMDAFLEGICTYKGIIFFIEQLDIGLHENKQEKIVFSNVCKQLKEIVKEAATKSA